MKFGREISAVATSVVYVRPIELYIFDSKRQKSSKVLMNFFDTIQLTLWHTTFPLRLLYIDLMIRSPLLWDLASYEITR